MREKTEVIQIMRHLERLTPQKIARHSAREELPYIEPHSQHVALSALQLYECSTPNPSNTERMQLLLASLGHDVGKNGVEEEILGKPKTLTCTEFGNMQTHTEKTFWLLSRAFKHGDIPNIAASHHEYWNGTGYPQGIEDHNIPRLTRIITIADIWNALTHKRVYQHNFSPPAENFAIMQSLRGTICDPNLLDSFLSLISPTFKS